MHKSTYNIGNCKNTGVTIKYVYIYTTRTVQQAKEP